MPASPITDARLFKIMGKFMEYGFERECKFAAPCPMAPNTFHVTVVCLEKQNFAEYYDYVSASELVS